jgi:outer membrane murein-binding lipoprotein Lpp
MDPKIVGFIVGALVLGALGGYIVGGSRGGQLQAQITNLTSQVSSLQSQVTTLQSQISILQSDKTTLQGQITGLQADKTSLQAQVTSLQANNTELATENRALMDSLSTLQNQILGNGSLIVHFECKYGEGMKHSPLFKLRDGQRLRIVVNVTDTRGPGVWSASLFHIALVLSPLAENPRNGFPTMWAFSTDQPGLTVSDVTFLTNPSPYANGTRPYWPEQDYRLEGYTAGTLELWIYDQGGV